MELDTNVIETELIKANITDQVINKMREDYLPLKVKDIYDKPGFEAVTTARKDVKKFRVNVEKILKLVRQPALEFQKAVVAKEKEVVAKISEIEDYLTSQEDIYNRKVEEVKTLTPDEQDREMLAILKKQIDGIKFPELQTDSAKQVGIQVKLLLNQASLLIIINK
jgi:hypothetical protein